MTSLLRKTIFYSNPMDSTAKQHTLSVETPFLTFYDKERGYVRKETLLHQIPALQDADIGPKACIVETLEEAGTFVAEVIRLPIY
jgi:hypothetical protein